MSSSVERRVKAEREAADRWETERLEKRVTWYPGSTTRELHARAFPDTPTIGIETTRRRLRRLAAAGTIILVDDKAFPSSRERTANADTPVASAKPIHPPAPVTVPPPEPTAPEEAPPMSAADSYTRSLAAAQAGNWGPILAKLAVPVKSSDVDVDSKTWAKMRHRGLLRRIDTEYPPLWTLSDRGVRVHDALAVAMDEVDEADAAELARDAMEQADAAELDQDEERDEAPPRLVAPRPDGAVVLPFPTADSLLEQSIAPLLQLRAQLANKLEQIDAAITAVRAIGAGEAA